MGTFDPVRKVYRANFNKYSEKGTSDILGIWRGKMLCIEVKSATGRLRPEQKNFLDIMSRLGAITLLARSLQCVLNALAGPADSPHTNRPDSCGK
jgi:putative heme degradation protein